MSEPAAFDRRQWMQRSLTLGGALLWTAPVIQAVGPAAFAAASPPPESPTVAGVSYIAAVITCRDALGVNTRYRVRWEATDAEATAGQWDCAPGVAPECIEAALPLAWDDPATLAAYPVTALGCAETEDSVEAPFDLEVSGEPDAVVLRILRAVDDCFFDGGSAGAVKHAGTCTPGSIETGPNELRWEKGPEWTSRILDHEAEPSAPERLWEPPGLPTPTEPLEFGGGLEVPQLPDASATP